MKVNGALNLGDVGEFRKALLVWYQANRRNLPWRRTRDPYRIWLSEIMLQQTRVAAVVAHYRRFLSRFPTVEKLAAAREASVLAQWSGLGYYRRARNLHAAAKVVVKQRGGVLPQTAAELRSLPGIGRYTAAAIASIVFGEPAAVVDGNVERVIARITGTFASGAQVWGIAEQMLSREHPADWNQAMMELGATVCLPGEPRCLECPIRKFCNMRGKHNSPARSPRQIQREIAHALAQRNGSILLVQRSATEKLMPGMWELPQVRSYSSDDVLFSLRHSITVTDFTVRVVRGNAEPGGAWIRNSRLETLALTGLAKKILRRADIIE